MSNTRPYLKKAMTTPATPALSHNIGRIEFRPDTQDIYIQLNQYGTPDASGGPVWQDYFTVPQQEFLAYIDASRDEISDNFNHALDLSGLLVLQMAEPEKFGDATLVMPSADGNEEDLPEDGGEGQE